MPIVHGVPPSPFVRKVRVALAEKGISYELNPQVPFNQPPEFLAISPLGKIPVYQDGDFTLPDSSVICAYLERTEPNPPLYPSDPKEFAKALWYEEYADSRLAESVGAVFFNRVVKAKFFNEEPDREAVARALAEDVPKCLGYLEGELGESDALVGGRFSIADIAVTSQLQQLAHGGESLDASRWPKLARYFAANASRPSMKACIEEETAAIAAM